MAKLIPIQFVNLMQVETFDNFQLIHDFGFTHNPKSIDKGDKLFLIIQGRVKAVTNNDARQRLEAKYAASKSGEVVSETPPIDNIGITLLKIGQSFGNTLPLTKNEVPHGCFFAAQPETVVISMVTAEVQVLLDKITTEKDLKNFDKFLCQTITNFQSMGNQQRRAFKECLVERKFCPGSKLIEEGRYCNKAFLIKDGECTLCSSVSPKQIYVGIDGSINIKPKPAWNQSKGVFTGRTTDTFTFGIKGPMQWVGEDVVIMGHNEPYRYSVVAVTRMKVYAIEKQDLLQRLNVTFISHLIKQAKIRTEWIEERIKQIHYSVKQIDEMQEVTKEDRDEWKRNKLY